MRVRCAHSGKPSPIPLGQQGHRLMGCMWLADISFEWEGGLILLPLPVEVGSRYGVWHCCNHPTLTREQTTRVRRRWECSPSRE